MALTQVSTSGITAAAKNAEDGLVKYLRTGDGVYTIFTPDGSTVSTSGTTTEGLQEAINYANTNGFDFYCAGGGIETSSAINSTNNTDVGVISCSTSLQIPACQLRSFVFKNTTIDFTTAVGSNAGLKFDSFMMLDFDFAGQIVYHGNGNAVEFDAVTNVPLDGFKTQVDSRIKIDTIAYVEGGTDASPNSACISFKQTQAAATLRNSFIFGEINGSGYNAGTSTVTLVARNGIVLNHSGVKYNIFDIQGIHHFKEAGLIVGQSTGSPAPVGNQFRIGLMEPYRVTSGGGIVALGLRSYGQRNHYTFSITNNGGTNQNGITGAFAHAVKFESSCADEFVNVLDSVGATSGVITSSSNNNNTLYHNGAKLDGNFLVGTPIENVFNGAGGNSQMVVAGTDTNTAIHSNVNASITISNKDGTANNLAGLHFAREDNDGSPHYCGASIVAQFLETMADGQYPKANLSFLTSSSSNAAPSEKMVLVADGKLGLGTNSPAYPISIVKSGGGDTATLGIQNTQAGPAGIHLLSGHGNWSIFNSSTVGNNFEIKDDSLSVFLIDTNHDIKLNDGTTARNQIVSDHSDAANAVNRRGFHCTDGPALCHGGGGNAGDRLFEAWSPHGGQAGSQFASKSFQVNSDGSVLSKNNTFGQISDEKLKQDIVDSGSQWDDIKAVKIKKYRFKSEVTNLGEDKAVTQIGVVAQDLETAGMNGLVDELPDIIDNVDQGTVTKSVKYSVLNIKAIKALQEAMTRIETLEAKVAALESGS